MHKMYSDPIFTNKQKLYIWTYRDTQFIYLRLCETNILTYIMGTEVRIPAQLFTVSSCTNCF